MMRNLPMGVRNNYLESSSEIYKLMFKLSKPGIEHMLTSEVYRIKVRFKQAYTHNVNAKKIPQICLLHIALAN